MNQLEKRSKLKDKLSECFDSLWEDQSGTEKLSKKVTELDQFYLQLVRLIDHSDSLLIDDMYKAVFGE